MQLAVAAYACPTITAGHGDDMMSMSTDDTSMAMSHCAGMDKAQPNLCNVHDQVGNQSLDKPNSPQVQPFIAATLTLLYDHADVAKPYIPVEPTSPDLARTIVPPLAIRNCCFRN
jgi:hypothetical protein